MTEPSNEPTSIQPTHAGDAYTSALNDLVRLLESARRAAARSVNSLMTAMYWEIGRRIVELEQGGESRATYGAQVMDRLSQDLTARFGRGFKKSSLFQMRLFYLTYPTTLEPLSNQSEETEIFQTLSGKFTLSWSHYVKLLAVKDPQARAFYEAEALRGGWSTRQLARQLATQYYERTLLSRNKLAMLEKGSLPNLGDRVSPEDELRDPFVLEFLNLKDEYSENDLEEALIHHIESFLLELGTDFAFLGRQRRLSIGEHVFRVDLIFFHRRLRCLVLVDLKLGEFTHADAGQMHLYLNYAREHWTYPDENPPVGLILCNKRDEAVAHYALEGLPNKIMAAEYQMRLPEEKVLVAELERTRKRLEDRKLLRSGEEEG